MWVFLRKIYILSLWAGVFSCGWWFHKLWKSHPGEFLEVGWAWFAGAFVFGAGIVALGISLSLPHFPLPPAVSPFEELRRWVFNLVALLIASSIFTVDAGILVLLLHRVKTFLGGWNRVSKLVGIIVIVGWIIGTFVVLAWLGETSVVRKFRSAVSSLDLPSAEDIVLLIEKTDLPRSLKQRWIKEIKTKGLCWELAEKIQQELSSYMGKTEAPSKLSRYGLLYESLENWLEHREEK